ncbi:MAG: squalene--hopene cyclase [Phycisphaerae bacterium]|nr:squalene--hopene cyclase [Phycisphaerae bacterium]
MSPTAAILPSPPAAPSRGAGGHDPRRLAEAVAAAADALMRKQRTEPIAGRGSPGRHWCAELEGDSILSSEYLLMKFILGQEHERRPTLERIANHLRLTQRPDGSWGQYPGSPPDVSACVKAYFCLKLMGDRTEAPHMARARELILSLGGAERCNTFSTFYLACLGQVSWNACPAIPPQVILLPRWFPFHIKKVAAWTRTMILPLAICSALRPVRELGPDQRIDELFLDPRWKFRLSKRFTKNPFTWNNFFLVADRFMKACRAIGLTPLRRRSLRRAEAWIVERMRPETTEGLGAIFPPMVYVQIAFRALGYTRDHPVIRQAEADLDAFMIDEPHPDPRLDHVRLQPCFSPVWDTAIALDALGEAGRTAADDERIAGACDWLRDREVRIAGDHTENFRPEDRSLRPGVDTAMWAFEYRNDWYPDVDDTCMVARALARVGDRPGQTANRDAAARAVRWILAMQNDDGGWAAFDRTRPRNWMEAIPFADHNAMQDPSCSDITGRVLESIIVCGLPVDHPAVRRGVDYILRTQQPEGCWWGRWGVNYIYGTWQAVCGLRSAGLPADHPQLVRVRDWLLSIQNADGGFGESANSYLDRSLMGKGPSTASQTAWALITLLHLLPASHPACAKAAAWLLDDQLTADKPPFATRSPEPGFADDHVRDLAGGWSEHWFTGTGFPKVFYLRYHLYRHSFPLKALARYARGA